MKIAVAGAGPAGLSAALLLSRAGHEVVLVERDPFDGQEHPDALGWERPGTPQFGQPHGLIARGRNELRAGLSDVYRELLDAGALEIRIGEHVPPPSERLAEDELLTYLAVRRPVIEWALRRALLRDRLVKVLAPARVIGLAVQGGAPPRVTGVETDEGAVPADLVVDAGGRRSPIPAWLRAHGAVLPAQSSDVGFVYYSRYYQLQTGRRLPDLGAGLGPRGDLGFCAFACFVGDANTFAFALLAPMQDAGLRVLRHAAAYDAFCQETPALREWMDSEQAVPLTGVMPMGSLQNTIVSWRSDGRPAVIGLVPVADAWIHTDPALALGLSNSLVHPRALSSALARQGDVVDAADEYFGVVEPDARERFALATAIADGRQSRLRGDGRLGPEVNLPFFLQIAGGATAAADPEIFRRVWRRNGYLESTAVLESDQALVDRIRRIFTAKPAPPPPAVDREALLKRLNNAVG